MNSIYLDHNASTPVRPEVLEAMLPYLKNEYGNASSVHQMGQRARKAIEEARANVAALINAADPNEIIFTSGGTEANNMAIKGVHAAHHKKGLRMVASAIEHSAVRHVLHYLRDQDVIDMVTVPVQANCIVRPEDVDDAMSPDTILATIMLANNETGTIQPIAAIAEICRKKNILFMTDAVQAAGKFSIDVQTLGADIVTLSGHKFGSAKGVGILYLRKGTKMYSLVHGGSQEKNRRGGTENVPGIVGMGVAATLARLELPAESERLRSLRNKFEDHILKTIPKTFINGDKELRTCNTSNICFEYADSSAMIISLDLKGIACSNGSACASGNPEPSHVLLAMGLRQDRAHSSIRFSLGHTTTDADIQQACEIIPGIVERLRSTHPLWKKAG